MTTEGKFLIYKDVVKKRYIIYPDGTLYDTKLDVIKHQYIKYGKDHHGGKYDTGYSAVALSSVRNGIKRSREFLVHRLVATMFIPNPDNLPMVNHIDGNKNNNNISNLEWCTSRDNNIHAIKTGLRPIGEDSVNSIYTTEQIRQVCELLDHGAYKNTEIEKITGIPLSTIHNVKCGLCWTHISKDYTFIIQQRIPETTARKICEYLELGFEFKEISKMFDVTLKTVTNIRYGNTWKDISCEYTFPLLKNHHLSPEEVHVICKYLQDGMTVNDISSTTGVSTNKIYKIRSRKTWTEISSNYTF